MKSLTTKKITVIDSTTGKDFEQEFNAKSAELATTKFEIIWNTNAGHCAYFLYEATELVPEDIRDEYILRGEEKVCSDCPHFVSDRNGVLGECKHPKVRVKTKSGKLDGAHPACIRCYEELEEGGVEIEE